jgi:hypothetical protein
MSRTNERSLFVLRDADALGLTLEEANGLVRIRSMSLPGLNGIFPGDYLQCKSLESALSEFLNSKSQSIQLTFFSLGSVTTTKSVSGVKTSEPEETAAFRDEKYLKKGDNLCRKGKFVEAASSYALIEGDNALGFANKCTALQLAKKIEEASVEANRMIQKFAGWEMGYVRKASCQMELRDLHGAIRTLAQGINKLPQNTSLLWRLRDLIPEGESEVSCLGNDSDTILSILHPYFFTNKLFAEAFSCAAAPDLGMKVVVSFNPLVPVGSEATEINGIPVETWRFPELKHRMLSDVQAVTIQWRPPTADKTTNGKPIIRQTSGRVGEGTTEPLDEAQLALRLSAVPQSSDQVIVFGSGQNLCNGDYYPQGVRNEKPWFENEFGVCLSYEQGESGACGWILGDPNNGKVYFVLRPGHEPRGEDFGEWISVDSNDNPPPSFVGVGDKVPSLKKLTMWVKGGTSASGVSSSINSRAKTMVPHLLGLKGHAIRLYEGGWYKEAIEILDLIVDQALALAVGDERCPSVELARIADSAREMRRKCMEQLKQQFAEVRRVDMQMIFDGFTLATFDDQLIEVEFKVIDSATLWVKPKVASRSYRMPKNDKSRLTLFGLFGCTRRTPATSQRRSITMETEHWNQNDVEFKIASVGAWKKFVVSNKSLHKTWEMNMPADEKLVKAFQQWVSQKQNVPATLSDSEIGWI